MSLFSIYYINEGIWSVKNSNGEWWTDNDGWVHPNSSWWAMDPDCYNKIFSKKELMKFINEEFQVDMSLND